MFLTFTNAPVQVAPPEEEYSFEFPFTAPVSLHRIDGLFIREVPVAVKGLDRSLTDDRGSAYFEASVLRCVETNDMGYEALKALRDATVPPRDHARAWYEEDMMERYPFVMLLRTALQGGYLTSRAVQRLANEFEDAAHDGRKRDFFTRNNTASGANHYQFEPWSEELGEGYFNGFYSLVEQGVHDAAARGGMVGIGKEDRLDRHI